MAVPSQLRRGIERINALTAATLGTRPLFSWQWGADLIAVVPELDLSTGRLRYTPETSQLDSGIYVVRHETDMRTTHLVERPYRNSFVFCYEDCSKLKLARWNPWCPEAYTPDGRRVTVIHSAPYALPGVDYVHEVNRQALFHLDVLHRTTKEARTAQIIERATLTNEQRWKRTRESVRLALSQLPVGGFRDAGDKSSTSFPGVTLK